ncbi:MAG: hypothetical protein WD971_13465 [Pirellulales bacterium]
MTFSIVVVAIWAVMVVFAHVERSHLVDELDARITRGTVKQATAALRQMVRMPEPPLETFVLAAASPSRQIARQAQDSIGELLRKWQSQLKSKQNARRIADRLERLAAALDAERESISALDYPWLAKTTEKILRLANAAPPHDTLGLALHCESLLTTTNPRTVGTSANVVPVASAAVDRAPDSIFSPPSRLALQSLVPQEEATDVHASHKHPAPPPASGTSTPAGQLRWTRPGLDETSKVSLPRPFHRRQVGATEMASPIRVDDSASTVSSPTDPWAMVDSRSLLARWLSESGQPKQQIERELQRRGFGRLRADVVRVALSDDHASRVQLVHDVLDTPGVGGKAWLMLLAEDADAEVRLSAVTVMSTSHDAELLEKAWQVALHDHDPRVADLAERLRDRRGHAERR